MRTLSFLFLVLLFASCAKEKLVPEVTEAGVAKGYNLIVPKEIFINEQLTQVNTYENGRIKQSLFPGGTGVATFSYDDVNNTTTSTYTEEFYHATTVDTYDDDHNLVNSATTGEFLDFCGSFYTTTTYTYLNGKKIKRITINGFKYPGFDSKTTYEESFFYQGPKLAKVVGEHRNYQNDILQFIENQESVYTWQNASNFTIATADNQQTIMEFSPNIKSPYFYTGEITYPSVFKNQDHRQQKQKFEVNSNMLRTFFSSTSELSGSTSSISITKMAKHQFPEEYVQEDVSYFGDQRFTNTTKMRFSYIEIAPKN